MDEQLFVFTAIGKDRLGMVDDLSRLLEKFGCNILESRMAVLGGDFAVMMLAESASGRIAELQQGLDGFGSELQCQLSLKATSRQQNVSAGKPYILQAYSIDAPGIVHSVTSVLHNYGINIEDLTTDTCAAPWTGTPMFQLRAHIVVPAGVSPARLKDAFTPLEQEKDLDIVIKPYSLDWMEK